MRECVGRAVWHCTAPRYNRKDRRTMSAPTQRVTFVFPGNVSHTVLMSPSKTNSEFKSNIGKALGALKRGSMPSIGMSRMRMFSDADGSTPLSTSRARRSPSLKIQVGSKGMPLSQEEEMVFIPKVSIKSDGIKSITSKDQCVSIDGRSCEEMGFVESLLSILCPMSGLCGDIIRIDLEPETKSDVKTGAFGDLFDPDRVASAANARGGSLRLVAHTVTSSASKGITPTGADAQAPPRSKRSIALSFKRLGASPAPEPPVVSAAAATPVSKKEMLSIMQSSPPVVTVELPTEAPSDTSDVKFALQTSLRKSGVDLSRAKDVIVKVKKHPVSIFSGSLQMDQMRGITPSRLIRSAQKKGMAVIF